VLDAFIIEQIKKREESRQDKRPVLELPIPSIEEEMPTRDSNPSRHSTEIDFNIQPDNDKSGVVVIELV